MASEAGENGRDRTESFAVLSEGTIVGHYKVIRKIGVGGMGEVFLAEDTELNRRVALKFLPFEYTSDEGFKARFKREAQATAALSHPNIVTIHEVGEYQGRPFFAMEYVEGYSLKESAHQKELSLDQIIDLAIQICEGLQEAHAANIVHRDIKPSNILISKSGRPKLVDFGLAAIKGEERLTKAGTTMGTIGYMSPEQVQGQEVDQRSDIFSLGVVLYEMITGRAPFKGDTEAAVLNSILSDTPEPLGRYKAKIPAGLQEIVDKALDKDLETRYQTATGVLADLKRVKKATDLGLATRTYIAPRRKPRSGVKRVLVPGLILAAIVFMILMLQPWKIEIRPTQDVVAAENRLAIMYFDNLADPEDPQRFGEIVTNLLIADLSESRYVQVVSSQRLYDILKLIGREGTKRVNKDVASQVARRAQANWMLLGSILQTEPQMVVTSQLVETETGSAVASQRVACEVGEDIFTLVDKLTVEIKKDLALPAAAQQEPDRPVAEVTTHSPEAYRYYLEGLEYSSKLYNAEAMRSYENALELDSTFAMAYARLAMFREGPKQKELIAKALEYSDRASQREKQWIRAIDARASGDYPRYIQELHKITDEYPHDKEAFYWMGIAYYMYLRQPEKAIPYYSKAIEIDPLYKDPYNMLAYAYDLVDDFEKSIWAINQYISLAPDEANPYDSRGDLYAYNGRIDQAIESYRKALEKKPDFYPSELKLGHMYLFEREYAKAESSYKVVASSSEKEARAVGRLALSLVPSYQGKLQEALQVVDAGLAADRMEQAEAREPEKHYAKAWIHLVRREPELALKEAELAEESHDRLHSDDPMRYRPAHAFFLAEAGRIAEAEELLREMKKDIKLEDVFLMHRYWASLGAIELVKGNANSAVAHLERVQRESPSPGFAVGYRLAEAYLESGKLADAVELLESMLSRYDEERAFWAFGSVMGHYLLGTAYEESGWTGKAVEEYEEFLDICKDADPGIEAVDEAKERLARLKTAS